MTTIVIVQGTRTQTPSKGQVKRIIRNLDRAATDAFRAGRIRDWSDLLDDREEWERYLRQMQ